MRPAGISPKSWICAAAGETVKAGFSVAVIAACPFPIRGGTPIRILRMAESLAARGHHVEVITYHLGQRVVDLPFAVHRIPRVPTYQRLKPGPSYQKLLLVDPLLAARWLPSRVPGTST